MLTRLPFAGSRVFRRAMAGLTALLLLGSATESAWADGHCAHHAALPGDFTAPPRNATSPVETPAHGGQHAPATHDAQADDAHNTHDAATGDAQTAAVGLHDAAGDVQHQQEAHGCTCLSDCAVSGALVVPTAAHATTDANVSRTVVPHEPPTRLATAAVLELLPYAQAPPVL